MKSNFMRAVGIFALFAFLLHPLSRDGTQAPYYAFNASTQTGCEYLAAIGSFLGSRYSGTGHGNVDNWVIAELCFPISKASGCR